MKTLFGILSILIFQLSFSQNDSIPIIKDSIKKPGIYKTFDEFKNNNPSIKLEYKILSVDKNFRTNLFGDKITLRCFNVNMPKEKARELGTIFGFSDGQNFYIINSDNPGIYYPNFAHNFNFNKLEYVGKYSVFESIENPYNAEIPSLLIKIINIKTGDIETLTVDSLKKILADKPLLLEKFKNQNKKYSYLKKYILEYLKS